MSAAEDQGDVDDLEDFAARLRDAVDLIQALHKYTKPAEAFVHWCVSAISPTLSGDQVGRAIASRGPRDKGIDGAWFDDRYRDSSGAGRGAYLIVQGKYGPIDPNEPYGDEAAKDLRHAWDWLVSDLAAERAELRGIKREFFDRLSAGIEVRFLVLIPGRASESLQQALAAINQAVREEHPNVRFEVLDLALLHGVYLDKISENEVIPDQVQFKVLGGFYKAKKVPGNAYVAEIPLNELYKLVKGKELELFSKNLRVHLATSSFNQGIRDVIKDELERKHFWYYNNGITAICDRVETVADPFEEGDFQTLRAYRMQIVNGCQTCVSVAREVQHWEAQGIPMDPLRGSSVLMRIIEVGDVTNHENPLGAKIAQYTNSQTPITGRDLRAIDPRQAELREAFRDNWQLFLELKKGEWNRRNERSLGFRNAFQFPSYIQNDRIGQYFMAFWLNKPAFAKSNKKKILDEQQYYDMVFGRRIPDEAYGVALFFYLALEDWRKTKGFAKRQRGSKGRTRGFSRAEVMKHADLLLLSSLGRGIQAAMKISSPGDLQKITLKAMAEGVRSAHSKFLAPGNVAARKLQRTMGASYDTALRLLAEYSKQRAIADKEANVRNILVRESTWEEFSAKHAKEIEGLGRTLVPLLGTAT